MNNEFLPLCRADMEERGWDRPDFVYVTGDAYVDHPSFGAAIISRVLEAEGFRVAMLAQPDFRSCEAFREYGRPRLGFLVTAGNIDSMVAHYTAAKKKRTYDYYSPGGKIGFRPDRAVIVYSNRIREAFGDVPIILGGLEASLRRLAHYDYWDDKIRRSILVDSGADLLTYGMGENILRRIAVLLDKGVPIRKIRDVRGTVYLTDRDDRLHYETADSWEFEDLQNDKKRYAEAFGVQYRNTDSVTAKAIVEYYGTKMLVQNPPMPPLEREELDRVYALPFTRRVHPSYEKQGGVPAIAEVEMSITHNRGCFGACNFCAIAFHQGRTVRSRSIGSVVAEAKLIAGTPGFKGYIHDVGGPTANFRCPACEKQLKAGVCTNRKCLAPTPCKNLIVDHSEYIELLKQVEAVPGVKKVFIRSGIRFDYVMADRDEAFFKKLVRDHVSGQLKVAPEHCSDNVLAAMGKPTFGVYEAFRKRYFELSKSCGKEQYLVPYLMSSHPGSRLSDAVELAVCLKKGGYAPEQVQDFYPTPGTASTVMYYTGFDPLTMKPVYCARDPEEKRMQRALLQYNRPENAAEVRKALLRCGRADLIGNGPDCLVRPERNTESRSDTRRVKTEKGGDSGSTDVSRSSRRENGKPDASHSPQNRSGRTDTSRSSRSENGKSGSWNGRPDNARSPQNGSGRNAPHPAGREGRKPHTGEKGPRGGSAPGHKGTPSDGKKR